MLIDRDLRGGCSWLGISKLSPDHPFLISDLLLTGPIAAERSWQGRQDVELPREGYKEEIIALTTVL